MQSVNSDKCRMFYMTKNCKLIGKKLGGHLSACCCKFCYLVLIVLDLGIVLILAVQGSFPL